MSFQRLENGPCQKFREYDMMNSDPKNGPVGPSLLYSYNMQEFLSTGDRNGNPATTIECQPIPALQTQSESLILQKVHGVHILQ